MTPINIARAVITVSWFALFVAISIRAWWKWRGDEDLAIARLPLEDTEHIPNLPEEHV